MPLIDAERNFYQVDAAKARELQAALEYQQTVQDAFGEVSDALSARQYYREVLQAQETQTKALRGASERVLKRYQVGYSSYFEVIDADQSLFTAELQRIQAYRNSLTAVVQLYKALGGGWQAAALEPAAAGTEPAKP
jgi:multidrug efflux system outer membrane protein